MEEEKGVFTPINDENNENIHTQEKHFSSETQESISKLKRVVFVCILFMLAEFVGTAFLLAAVVGSGIMAEQLSDDVGLQLLENAFATAGALVALILAFQAASGAHFNPAVSLLDRLFGDMDSTELAGYVAAQIAGGITGVITANLMFDLDPVEWSTKDRSAFHLVFGEGVATLGLLLVIHGVVREAK